MIEFENISLKVQEEKENVTILDNVNLNLDENKIYVITGPNGGGKSSFCKIMMGIYKATSGKIIFDGKDISNTDITERAKLGIGYAFQQPPRFKGMTVRELLQLSSKHNENKVNPAELLINVGLCPQDYIDREVNGNLSGGELKRIEIATILARNLKLAIFDEPEAGIDLWSFKRLVETFKELHEKTNTTIVIISHQERIINLADEIIVLSNGKIKQQTSKEEIIEDIKNATNCDFCKNYGGRRE